MKKQDDKESSVEYIYKGKYQRLTFAYCIKPARVIGGHKFNQLAVVDIVVACMDRRTQYDWEAWMNIFLQENLGLHFNRRNKWEEFKYKCFRGQFKRVLNENLLKLRKVNGKKVKPLRIHLDPREHFLWLTEGNTFYPPFLNAKDNREAGTNRLIAERLTDYTKMDMPPATRKKLQEIIRESNQRVIDIENHPLLSRLDKQWEQQQREERKAAKKKKAADLKKKIAKLQVQAEALDDAA